jgi:hypothetical protein
MKNVFLYALEGSGRKVGATGTGAKTNENVDPLPISL